jgi:hemerythrin-like domain-containing protein
MDVVSSPSCWMPNAMPIIETLARDHRNLEEHLDALAALRSTERQERTRLFSRVQALLIAHARAEEEVVYRPLRARLPDEVKLYEAYEEHHITDVLLQELAADCPGDEGWSARTRVLNELVRHHIKEEELHLFALIEQELGEQDRERMDEEFRAVKHERAEALLGPLRQATPAFLGRAVIEAQASGGRWMRRGELFIRRRLGRVTGRRMGSAG